MLFSVLQHPCSQNNEFLSFCVVKYLFQSTVFSSTRYHYISYFISIKFLTKLAKEIIRMLLIQKLDSIKSLWHNTNKQIKVKILRIIIFSVAKINQIKILRTNFYSVATNRPE